MYSYKPLENKLKEIDLTKSDLTTQLGISSRTVAKISKGEKIANNVLVKIADFCIAILTICSEKFAIITFCKFCVKKKRLRFQADFIMNYKSE